MSCSEECRVGWILWPGTETGQLRLWGQW